MYVVIHAYTRWIISNVTEKGNCPTHYIICTSYDLNPLHFFLHSLTIRIISIHLHTLVSYKYYMNLHAYQIFGARASCLNVNLDSLKNIFSIIIYFYYIRQTLICQIISLHEICLLPL